MTSANQQLEAASELLTNKVSVLSALQVCFSTQLTEHRGGCEFFFLYIILPTSLSKRRLSIWGNVRVKFDGKVKDGTANIARIVNQNAQTALQTFRTVSVQLATAEQTTAGRGAPTATITALTSAATLPRPSGYL